jgi:two-component system sensor histidine kinase KdpD
MISDSGKHQGDQRRPCPDALLKEARQEERGRLKIFLGAAPGVGKTYEMLSAARARQSEGMDVVVGVVETHGRKETEALLESLEVLPRRAVDYKGQTIQEMDLDAILARHPRLVLIDELAHTNAPGSRHPKRYMDVEELIAAGIDVFTTLNIQHVESLNDVVAKITRVRVRETVPDSVLDQADDIEIIDLTPEDLIERLHAGKVYVPEAAERALKYYFSPGNLTALRELALRRTAQRVDAQMVDYMRSHAIEGPWAAGDRVLACISGAAGSSTLVRQARRMADRLRAPWTVLHIERTHPRRSNEAERDRVAEALGLASRLGGEAVMLPNQKAADAILDYAKANNFTHIIIGKSRHRHWWPFETSTVDDLIRHAGAIHLHILADEKENANSQDRHDNFAAPRQSFAFKGYAISLCFVAMALAVALALQHTLTVTNSALAFLVAILASAVAYGLLPSLVACLAAVLAYNFFLLPPLYTFSIADPENVVALFFFTIVAVIASNLAARVRAQAIAARQRARVTEELYLFSRKLAGAGKLDDLLWTTVHQVALMLKVRVVLLLPTDGRLAVQAGFPPEDQLDDNDLAAAQWCYEKNKPAGRGADTLPGAKRLFVPLQTGRSAVGIIGIDSDEAGPLLTSEQMRLLTALSDQAALAIERVQLAEEMDQARIAAETEKLRSALLTSISHDLRTPLASILGAATSLAAHGDGWDKPTRVSLMQTIREEAERLNRFIGNLLDMTRLEAGSLIPKIELVDLAEIVGATLQRAKPILQHHKIATQLAPGLPMLQLDMVLMEQVLFNLLDNAAKYAPNGSQIAIQAQQIGDQIRIDILDEGDGLPAEDLERIFDKFYRVHRADRQRAGTGLGLAICRGFVEAMGGSIAARNREDRSGACFTLLLPVPVLPVPAALPTGDLL